MGILSRQSELLETQLAEARKRISELEAELSKSASRDGLTESLLTLRAFRDQLELDVQRAHRYGRPLSVAIIDVDGFRDINLDHGYAAGDAVLLAVAGVIGQLTRSQDLACRMGGDEFAILLPETGADGALQVSERILVELEDLQAGPVRGFSVSIGIAGLSPKQTPERLLSNAHVALGVARRDGGGRAAVFAGEGGSAEASEAAPA